MDQSDFERTAVTAEPVGQKQTEKKDVKKTVFMIAVPALAALALLIYALGRVFVYVGNYQYYFQLLSDPVSRIFPLCNALVDSAFVLLHYAAFVLLGLTFLQIKKDKKPVFAGISAAVYAVVLIVGRIYDPCYRLLLLSTFYGLDFSNSLQLALFPNVWTVLYNCCAILGALIVGAGAVLLFLEKKPIMRPISCFAAAGAVLFVQIINLVYDVLNVFLFHYSFDWSSLIWMIVGMIVLFLFALGFLALGLYYLLNQPKKEIPTEEAPSEETPAEETV